MQQAGGETPWYDFVRLGYYQDLHGVYEKGGSRIVVYMLTDDNIRWHVEDAISPAIEAIGAVINAATQLSEAERGERAMQLLQQDGYHFVRWRLVGETPFPNWGVQRPLDPIEESLILPEAVQKPLDPIEEALILPDGSFLEDFSPNWQHPKWRATLDWHRHHRVLK